jgi:hypothetical protein
LVANTAVATIAVLVAAAAHAAPPSAPANGPGASKPGAPASSSSAAASSAPVDPSVAQARDEFKRGTELAQKTEWAEALSAFEKSQALHAHPVTIFNLGICERALGSYTRARDQFALALRGVDGQEMPDSLKAEAEAGMSQIDALLVHARVTIDPEDALVSIDGRPLRKDGESDGRPLLNAGVLPPGAPEKLPQGAVEIMMNPGTHLITVSKPGYANVVVSKTFGNAERVTLPLSLTLMPATIHVSSDQTDTIVTIAGADVGMAPVDVSRHAGTYHVKLVKTGFTPYESDVTVKPGEEANLTGKLAEEKIPITKKWWFWTGVAAVVAGGALITYEVTRNPQPPPYNGGTAGWVVAPHAFRF